MNNNPIEELGKIMSDQMKRVNKDNTGIVLELGRINPNMSLSVDSLGNEIPKGEYMVSLHLQPHALELTTSEETTTTDKVSLTTSTEESHKHTVDEHQHNVEEHSHTVLLPNQLRGLQSGDRVTVLWAGTEPIVVDIVVSS